MNRILAQGGVHAALGPNAHGHLEWVLKDVGQCAGFLIGELARDLAAPAFNGAVDHRGGLHLTVQNDRQLPPDVLSRDLAEDGCPV